ncbi:MAG: pseudouridine-5'-phosphate glycosidase [Flavobacteriales bacterium]
MKDYLNIEEEVADALSEKRPVVALESTIIAHGMPWPTNLELAHELHQLVRDNGAVPATIAVADGKVQIGLSNERLEQIASASDCVKISRRDMAWAIATKQLGATTVATTMMGASFAGISWFVTGGIGGVHRGVAESWDISADLAELSHTPVAVITAGAKSILDIPKTLEVLESLGVPVLGYKTSSFPAFYCANSGCLVDHKMDSVKEIVDVFEAQKALNIKQGIIVANPIPQIASIDASQIESAIDLALEEAAAQNVTGKQLTPFLLARMNDLTRGKSLAANLALVKNNAVLGAQCAAEWSAR